MPRRNTGLSSTTRTPTEPCGRPCAQLTPSTLVGHRVPVHPSSPSPRLTTLRRTLPAPAMRSGPRRDLGVVVIMCALKSGPAAPPSKRLRRLAGRIVPRGPRQRRSGCNSG
jgi:hypothetical protein